MRATLARAPPIDFRRLRPPLLFDYLMMIFKLILIVLNNEEMKIKKKKQNKVDHIVPDNDHLNKLRKTTTSLIMCPIFLLIGRDFFFFF